MVDVRNVKVKGGRLSAAIPPYILQQLLTSTIPIVLVVGEDESAADVVELLGQSNRSSLRTGTSLPAAQVHTAVAVACSHTHS